MSGKGSFAVSRSHGGDRFYNPPAVRKKQQLLLQQQHSMQKQQLMPQQQQQELQRAAVKTESFAHAESGNRSESDGSNAALSKQDSVRSVSPPAPPPVGVTNLDRLMESVTPFIPAQCEAEVNPKPPFCLQGKKGKTVSLYDLFFGLPNQKFRSLRSQLQASMSSLY